MNLNLIEEPELEFGKGRSICPKEGISNFDVYDIQSELRKLEINIGAVGTSRNLEQLSDWLEICSRPISPKAGSKQPNLFFPFYGFNEESGFKLKVNFSDRLIKPITNSEIFEITSNPIWSKRIELAVEAFYQRVRFLAQNRNVDVIICIIPEELYPKIIGLKEFEDLDHAEDNDSTEILLNDESGKEINFRRMLKARCLHLGYPIQLILESSFDTNNTKKQDAATKAWNFCTALYYKASRSTVPWKIISSPNKPSALFVGIGFYRSRDRSTLNTSLAQIFNETGKGLILRGTPVSIDKNDRRPFLSGLQANELLKKALDEYETAIESPPSRLVVHKSSIFRDEELDGFRNAAKSTRVKTIDFVTVFDSQFRLFRNGLYPPFRGTHLEIDKKTHLLYTRGFVKHFKTYPGMYIPRPIEIRIVSSDESPNQICSEILSLTKMNWNNTQFDRKLPVTLACAQNVGNILKYLTDYDGIPQVSYRFYM